MEDEGKEESEEFEEGEEGESDLGDGEDFEWEQYAPPPGSLHEAAAARRRRQAACACWTAAPTSTQSMQQRPLTFSQPCPGWAAKKGHAAAAQLLLARGASSHVADSVNGWTQLHWAALGGSVEVARLLLDAGASLDAQSCGGCTPLHIACSR